MNRPVELVVLQGFQVTGATANDQKLVTQGYISQPVPPPVGVGMVSDVVYTAAVQGGHNTHAGSGIIGRG